MNIHNSLISTALLTLQQAGELKYHSKCGTVLPSGFYKTVNYIDADKLGQFTILIYLTSKSPTGYAVKVEAIASRPSASPHRPPPRQL
jgi:hypothetical protein